MRACTTDLPLKNQRRFNLGNDMPVYTFTTHIFKHRHPRLDWGYLHRLQHSHSRVDRESQNHCVISRAIIDTKVAKYTVN